MNVKRKALVVATIEDRYKLRDNLFPSLNLSFLIKIVAGDLLGNSFIVFRCFEILSKTDIFPTFNISSQGIVFWENNQGNDYMK
jgi:hypothetical protein